MKAGSLTVNGQRREFAAESFPATVLMLIESLGLNPEAVVAEVNGDIVGRDDFAAYSLTEGDKVELVRFVGGG